MSRTKSFDEDAILDRAAELFWDKGFESTSVSDLEEHLGLGRQSIYNTYGDKRTLFLKALERYGEWNRMSLEDSLLAKDASLPALRQFFDTLAEFLTRGAERRACLMINSILEFDHDDAAVMGKCQNNQERVRRAIEGAVIRAQERGEIARELDVSVVSSMLLAQVYGLGVLSKTGITEQEIKTAASQFLDRLM